MAFRRKLASLNSALARRRNAVRNRLSRLKSTNYKTVNGLPVYVTASGNYVTKKRTPIHSFSVNNGRRLVFSTKPNKVSKNGFYGLPVFSGNTGGFYSATGTPLWKHNNGKYYNYK